MDVDLAVIGGGPGGYVAAIRAGQLGLKVVCIDKRGTLGGTCLNVGCIPSKALLYASQQVQMIQHSAPRLGISCGSVDVDFAKMMSHKDTIVKGLVDGVAGLLKKYQVPWLVGEARLTAPDRIRVKIEGSEQTINAKAILLATGSESLSLPFLPIDETQIVTSTGALSLSKIPKKLLVIGAGVIGVELASVYRRLGSEVLVAEMLDQICPAMDPAISKTLLTILKRQGIDFRLGVKVTAAKRSANAITVSMLEKDQETQWTADVVLVAVGRKPYTNGLGLQDVGVVTDARGFVPVNGSFQTNVPTIYAIGDLIEGVMLAHRASEEGVAVAELLAGRQPHVNYMAIPNVIYTHPEVAAVGLTEPEAKQAGVQTFVGTFPMRANARARCMDETDGLVKVVGDSVSGRLVGLHIIASNASEMIGEGVVAIEHQETVEGLAAACHAHPTQSEAIKEACLQALGRPIHI